MRLTNFITESINDKGILKAVFFVGYPGAGKTTIVRKIKDGSMPVVSVSTDIWTEFYGDTGRGTEWDKIETSVKRLTIVDLVNRVNGLFPIFVDTTGADVSRFHKRVDFLRDMGYDVSLIIVDVDFETSKNRVYTRNRLQKRQVDFDFVKKAYDSISRSIPIFKGIIPDNTTIINKRLSDEDTIKAYNIIMKKLNSPIKNDKGKKLVDYMKEMGYKYYQDVPAEWLIENDFPTLDKNSVQWFNKE